MRGRWPRHSVARPTVTRRAGTTAVQESFSQKHAWDKQMMQAAGEERREED